jgi:hypothetical protein
MVTGLGVFSVKVLKIGLQISQIYTNYGEEMLSFYK